MPPTIWKGDLFQRGCGAHRAVVSLSLPEMDSGGQILVLSSMYWPQRDDEMLMFLEEMTTIREVYPGEWIIVWDFNLITSATYKNNSRIKHQMMNIFRSKIDELELKKMYLFERRYT